MKYADNRLSLWLLPLVLALATCGGAEAVRYVDAGAERTVTGGVDAPTTTISTPLPNAAACAQGGECESGFCVDGLCCDTACTGACMSCASSDRPGVCGPADPGTDPRNDCADDGVASCGRDGACDGTGACRKYPAGVVCQPASCTGSTLTFAALCDGAGTCQQTSSVSCGAYTCGGDGKCRATCSTDADCAPGTGCVNGSCGPKPPGAACAAATECASGHCEQSTCCTAACTGSCRSCAVAGSEGRCTSVPAGQDPLGQCADQGVASCGTDGSCDGKGACRLYVAGSVCAQPACTAGQATLAGTCDGAGTCGGSTNVDCTPFACGASGRCRTSCATASDCATGFDCIGSACRKRATGAACTTASQCASGFCQQGVCCGSACSGMCRSCNLPASAGTCAMVPAGQDPLNQCDSVATSTCGTDGTCDGAGGCRLYPAGTVCGAQTCTGSTVVLASQCDGRGRCTSAGTQPCAPFGCAAGACKTSCTGSGATDCASGNVCVNGVCGLKPAGTACGAGSECASSFCQQGVCCATACAGTCRSCNVAGSAGTCAMVPAGQDPLNQCDSVATSTCGTDGTCDGAGGCRKYPSGTPCVPATCSAGLATAARTCDGNGTCQPGATTSCAPFACGSSACNTTCASDADCASPNVCTVATGACGPASVTPPPPAADAGGD